MPIGRQPESLYGLRKREQILRAQIALSQLYGEGACLQRLPEHGQQRPVVGLVTIRDEKETRWKLRHGMQWGRLLPTGLWRNARSIQYVEPRSAATTKLTNVFSVLL
jgi:hypothetical protein